MAAGVATGPRSEVTWQRCVTVSRSVRIAPKSVGTASVGRNVIRTLAIPSQGLGFPSEGLSKVSQGLRRL